VKRNQKNTQLPLTVPSMSDFEVDEIISILMGVKPKSSQKPRKQESYKKSKKSD